MMVDTPINVRIDGSEYAINLDWLECNKNDNLRNIKRRESRSKGSCTLTFESDNNIFLGFAGKNQAEKISLAAATALYESNALYIYKVESIDKFWLNYVTADGRLSASMSDVIVDVDRVVDIINELLILFSGDVTNKLKIYAPDETIQEIQESLDEEEQYRMFGDSKILIQTFDIHSITSGKTLTLARIEEESANKKSSALSLLTLAVAVIVAGAGAYVYNSEPPEEYFSLIDGEFSAVFSEQERSLNRKISEKSNEFFTTKIGEDVKKDFVKRVESNTYELKEIIDYIEMLSISFPTYLVEWEVKDISFVKNDDMSIEFKVPYSRIMNSFGTYNEAKENIDDIMKRIPNISYSIRPTDVGRNSLSLSIKFKDDYVQKESKTIDEIKKEIEKAAEKTNKYLNKARDSIKAIEDEALDYSFLDKRVGSKVTDSVIEAEGLSVELKSLMKDKEKIYETLLKPETTDVPEEYYSLNREMFLNTMQENNHYAWHLSSASKSIPENLAEVKKLESTLKPKTKTKAKSKTKNEAPEVEIDWGIGYSWDFRVSSSDESTFGIEGLRNLIELINNKSITIKEVEYNFNGENWSLSGEFYEKK